MWHAGVLLIVHGFAGVLWGPASQMLIHEIVGGTQLQSGVRMLATSRKLGILLGPAIGGGLMLLFGPAFGLFINVLIYLPLILWLWKAPYGKPAEDGEEKLPHRALRGFADILPTLRSVAQDPTIFSTILLIGAASFLSAAHTRHRCPNLRGILDTEIQGFLIVFYWQQMRQVPSLQASF